jgi:hypothetical protein
MYMSSLRHCYQTYYSLVRNLLDFLDVVIVCICKCKLVARNLNHVGFEILT